MTQTLTASTPRAADQGRPLGGFLERASHWRGLPTGLLVVILFVINTILSPNSATPYSLTSFFATYLPSICLAIGVSFTMLVGGIDLSLGPVMGLSGIFTVLLSSVGVRLFTLGPSGMATDCSTPGICNNGIPFWAAALVGILVGGLFGALNGIAVAYFRLQPLMVTLATGFIAGGASLWIFPKPGGRIPDGLTASYVAARIPPLGLVITIVLVLAALAAMKTTWGVRMRAVGSDRTRAFAAGVPVQRTTASAYVASGVLAGIAGVLFTLNVASADPTLGATFTLNAVAGAVLGGAALRGGWAEPVGPALGAIALGLLNSLVVSLHISIYYQQLVSGIAIVVGLAATQVFFSRQRNAQ